MRTETILLNTPVGQIAIVKAKICAIASDVERTGTQVYVDGDPNPFNITEDFDTVCQLLSFSVLSNSISKRLN